MSSISLQNAYEKLRTYKPFLKHAIVVSEVNKNIAQHIVGYAYNKLIHIRDKLNLEDKIEFEKEVIASGFRDTRFTKVSYEVFNDFLGQLFKNMDKEEREAKSHNLEMTAIFRLIADLIEVLGEYNNITDEWIARSNLCIKFREVLPIQSR
jgi:hypothetical protein